MNDERAHLLVVHSEWREKRIAPHLASHGYRLEWCCPAGGDRLPGELDDYSGTIVQGGVQSANDAGSVAYMRHELDWVRQWAWRGGDISASASAASCSRAHSALASIRIRRGCMRSAIRRSDPRARRAISSPASATSITGTRKDLRAAGGVRSCSRAGRASPTRPFAGGGRWAPIPSGGPRRGCPGLDRRSARLRHTTGCAAARGASRRDRRT